MIVVGNMLVEMGVVIARVVATVLTVLLLSTLTYAVGRAFVRVVRRNWEEGE